MAKFAKSGGSEIDDTTEALRHGGKRIAVLGAVT
jgi:hypothetical protein